MTAHASPGLILGYPGLLSTAILLLAFVIAIRSLVWSIATI